MMLSPRFVVGMRSPRSLGGFGFVVVLLRECTPVAIDGVGVMLTCRVSGHGRAEIGIFAPYIRNLRAQIPKMGTNRCTEPSADPNTHRRQEAPIKESLNKKTRHLGGSSVVLWVGELGSAFTPPNPAHSDQASA